MLFTITTRCHITGRESEYKVSFPSEESLVKFFSHKKDKLLAVSDGWESINPTDIFQPESFLPHYKRNGRVEPAYNYQTDMIEVQY